MRDAFVIKVSADNGKQYKYKAQSNNNLKI